MTKAKIKVKNYRCFGHEPEDIEINTGFTAFIGLNNSGKSTILKMFYELRPVWNNLIHTGNLMILTKQGEHNINLHSLKDNTEIFNHFNNTTSAELIFEIPLSGDEKIEFTLQIVQRDSNQVAIKITETKINNEVVHFINHTSGNIHISYRREPQPGTAGGEHFTMSMQPIIDFFSELGSSVYIPSSRNVINTGEKADHFDISTGTAFIKLWDEWKTGSNKFQKQQIIKITENIRDLFGYKSLEISASSDKQNLILTIDSKPYSLFEVGSGLTQFILTFATVAIKKPTYIFIDEPELNLHPALQLKFLSNLASYASLGVVFATHSIGLARSAENVFSVTNDGKDAKIRPFSNTPNYAVLLGELSFSAYKEIGADCILFVEGVTDIRTMQELLRKFGKDNKALVMSLGGADMINGKREAELSEITTRVDVKKVYAWIDSEKDSDSAALAKDRQQFFEVCEKLGIVCGISQRRATENYFTGRAILAAFNDGNKTELAPYEKAPASANWSKDENWKIAKETTIEEIKETDLGIFIDNIEV